MTRALASPVRSPNIARISVLALISLVLIGGSMFLGRRGISSEDWAGISDLWTHSRINVFWHLRAPRVFLASVAGASLAIGGVVYQSLFRNSLAEPYTMGIASGAALGAATGMLLRSQSGGLAATPPGFFALCGAVFAMLLVYLMSRLRGGHDVARLLLAGVCVSYMSAAGILLAHLLADRAITNDIVRWTVGSLGILGWRPPLIIAGLLGVVFLVVLRLHRSLDLLAMGDVLAASRGVAVQRVFWLGFLGVGVLTSVVVAECGPIGFVGLIVPHIARRIVGGRVLPLLVASAFLGGGFLAICDGLGRSISEYDLPVGIFTNILGAGFFFLLLASGRRE